MILRRRVSEAEVPDILTSCHDSACGGHLLGHLQAKRSCESDTSGLPYLRIFTHT